MLQMRHGLLARQAALALALLVTISGRGAAQGTGHEGWISLFDGKTTAGWRGYRQQTVPAGWAVVDGALTRVAHI